MYTPSNILHFPLDIKLPSLLEVSGHHGVDVLLFLADHDLPLHVAHDHQHHEDEHSLILEYWHTVGQEAGGHLQLMILR